METMKNLEVKAAKKIWEIAGESPEMGNAVMDLLGDEGYNKVMEMQKLQAYDPNDKVYLIVLEIYDIFNDTDSQPVYAVFRDLDTAVNCVRKNLDDIFHDSDTEDSSIHRIEIQSRIMNVLEAYHVERRFDFDHKLNTVREYSLTWEYDDNDPIHSPIKKEVNYATYELKPANEEE